MNPVLQNICERRSVRTFLSEPVSPDHLKLILRAAIQAPSSMNKQARHYAVFSGSQSIHALDTAVKEATSRQPESRYFKRVTSAAYTISYGAPLFIMVMANPAVTTSPEADCACALQNMFLAARSLGIASVWINQLNTLNNEPGFRAYIKQLNIPEPFAIYGCGAFGYPVADWPKPPKLTDNAITFIRS